jgi:Fur family ferric uptake transcriptional regulator
MARTKTATEKQTTQTATADQLKTALRKSGYKATGARVAILEFFKRSRRPLSAQNIVDNIKTDIDQATIYRTLKSLKEKNIIRQVDLRHNHAHYEFAELTEHHHLICTRCGKIEDVQHCDIENMRSVVLKQSKHFAEIQEHSLEFYGFCKTCAKRD